MKTLVFYAYKGGTGRSLAVVNTAYFLARFGKRVVVMDLDLEAPGLHFKFATQVHKGVVDYLYTCYMSGEVPDVREYGVKISLPAECPNAGAGEIWLMPAGNAPSPMYAERLGEVVQSSGFFQSAGSKPPLAASLLLRLKEELQRAYNNPDYLLIDSRTGLTEAGNISTRLLADVLVGFFNSNQESISGLRRVLQGVRAGDRLPSLGSLEIVPVLARVPRQWDDLSGAAALKELNRTDTASDRSLDLDNLVVLRSDPDLQANEVARIGTLTTVNESALLCDYLRLFVRLGFDNGLTSDEASVINRIAGAEETHIRGLPVHSTEYITRPQNAHDEYSTMLWRDDIAEPSPRAALLQRFGTRGKKKLKVVKPDYMRGRSYLRFMNGVAAAFNREVARSLSESNSGPATVEKLVVSKIPRSKVPWHVLAERMREGAVDFCADLIWLAENRSYLLELIQLGWCLDFTACIPKAARLNLPPRVSEKYSLRDLLSEIQRNASIEIGVLGDTPAASEASRIFGGEVEAGRLISKDTEEVLAEWLAAAPHKRLIICDSVVQAKLRRPLNDASASKDCFDWSQRFVYEHPIPVGLAYPRGDSAWRRVVARAVADGLERFLPDGHWDDPADGKPSMAGEFRKANLVALTLDTLRTSLLRDLPFEYALEWDAKIGRLRAPSS
jgi:hypothetical protein